MSEVMEEPNYTIVEYNETASALAELKQKFGTVVFDVSTKKGLEEAKTARGELRGYRVNLETMRKNIKQPALDRCRLIDAEAKDITEQLTALEKPISAQIEAEETRKEQDKQAKLQVEIARVTALRTRISAFTELVDTIEPTSDACQEAIVRMKAIPIDDTFEELQPDAQQANGAALFRLQNLFAQYTANEAEADRIKEERAELEKLREADRLRREEDDRKAAAERQRLAAEQEAQLVEERRKATQLAEAEWQLRKAEEMKVREAQQAEQRRLDAQAAELRRQQDEAAKAERERIAAADAENRRQIESIDQANKNLRLAAPVLLKAGILLLKQYDESGDFIMGGKLTNEPFLMMRNAVLTAQDGMMRNADGTRSVFDDVDQ